MDPQEYSQRLRSDIVFFAKEMLGISFTNKQTIWLQNSKRKINILAPGNQWGKTLTEAIKHIHQAITKPQLAGRVTSAEQWQKAEYETLNFGLTYEIAKPVKEYISQLVEGSFLINDHETGKAYFNESKLKDWAIVDSRDNPFPIIAWKTGSKTFFRSYDNMGSSFKAKRLAFVSGDEVGDIPELKKFVNGTLLPRLVAMGGKLDLIGTIQADKSEDYLQMIAEAEDDEEGRYYLQRGSMYENTFLTRESVKETEDIADPTMRRQIIYGEYVDTGEKYFRWDEVQNMLDYNLQLIDRNRGGQYICAVDFAAAEDYTVIIVLDYKTEPYKLVYHQRFKGKKIPIPMQYELVKSIVRRFNARLIIDSSALGGKNALSFLAEVNPIGFEFTPKNKAEMLASFKIALQGGDSGELKRDLTYEGGIEKDLNEEWGLIKVPNIPELIKELQGYKLDDDSIKTDQVMALGIAIHWLMLRRPKKHRSVINIDLLSPQYLK